MEKIFDGFIWFFGNGWEIWTDLFSPLPYGDPYVAIVAAMVVFHFAYKTIYPNAQAY